ncbi:MAG: GTP cyclohydrolase 1 type 2 [Pseudohongiella sp.]|nr:MAG: GTP cyclohydrolase 1 type 2 [Pseudohongiella sp.]
MTVSLSQVVSELTGLLHPEQFKDYCPNGLQVEGKSQISKMVLGVTACQALIDKAIVAGADAILVHHGYFWRGEDESLVGMKMNRIKTLIEHDISLLAYHLPLDAHPLYGNNAQLGELLGFSVSGDIGKQNNHPIGLLGSTPEPVSPQALSALIKQKLNREPLVISPDSHNGDSAAEECISKVAWCTGAAQNYIELAIKAGADAYISGEISEPTVHIAREAGIHYFAAGHHATERYGVQAVGEWLRKRHELRVEFIDIDNPV